MDSKTMEEIRNALLDRYRQIGHISKTTGHDVEAAAEQNEPHAEIIDIAQGLEQLGRDMSLKEQERRELVAIERALTKMSTGNYGVCEDCGEPIPPKRLMVLPEARLCASCQAFEERQNQKLKVVGGGSAIARG
jgi:DnaK suppressor protein